MPGASTSNGFSGLVAPIVQAFKVSLISYSPQTTRVLAEEQFMKRALIEKILDGLPIGASIGSEWNFSF
jgi:hypothetical protein